ncbi:hypothetical protein DSO57_1012870 [Entomophthora muscae]|uniref:Uncharacterized protein n=1 Tax=Entomophthora muscae TaxID=34485 RepID=A0ACC2TTI5_9FUNG|nr:hypothetical protein DSO57_1012870 [Entomophthora muscae]
MSTPRIPTFQPPIIPLASSTNNVWVLQFYSPDFDPYSSPVEEGLVFTLIWKKRFLCSSRHLRLWTVPHMHFMVAHRPDVDGNECLLPSTIPHVPSLVLFYSGCPSDSLGGILVVYLTRM